MNWEKAEYRLFALFACACTLAGGADWLSKRGDPQQTGWQKEEKLLNTRTVRQLRLLWKQKLNGRPNGLTDPLLLGPIITHRGIKELVFVKNSSDTVYAVDADLGTIFWSRHLGESTSDVPCAESARMAPVMAPAPERPKNPKTEDNDNFSDANRPLYALSAEGRPYALRPSTGGDFSPPLPFLPPSAKPANLELFNNILYAATSPVCGGLPDRIWTLDLKGHSDPQWQPWKERSHALTTFQWKDRDLFAELTSNGKLTLSNAEAASRPARSGGLAAWQDAAGTRWINTTSANGIRAFQVTGPKDQPTALLSWASRTLTAAGPPVVANGILYFLSTAVGGTSNHLTLHALDALNGKELYSSGSIIASRSSSGNIALANGHVCFSADDGVLYCFGLPFEM